MPPEKPPSKTLQRLPRLSEAEIAAAQRLRRELEREALRGSTPEKRDAYELGLVPEETILHIVREELFAPFKLMPRWHKIDAHAVRHDARCENHAVEFEAMTIDANGHPFNRYAWESLEAIQAAAEIAADHHWLVRSAHGSRGIVVVEAVLHRALCKCCHAELTKLSAKVSMCWADRILVREYSL